jgi:hypothetical protein
MCLSRERLQHIVELAEEAEMAWAKKPRTSSLAFWLRDIDKAVIALDEGQERNEAEIGALSDAVDDIDARIGGTVSEVEDEPDPLDLEPLSGHGVVNLTAVPYETDHYLEQNEARIIDGKLYVGAAVCRVVAGPEMANG